ncbi:MAG: sugar ABC transporter substrate-binding protein [Bacillota bacterium]|nr:sugar ABC transporter substrate-binding protein [Bacillota bacterium]
MKKVISILLICLMVTAFFTSCSSGNKKKSPSGAVNNADIVDGKFVKTRSITVEVFDRGNDGGSKPEDNFYTKFIKDGMLRDHNVDVKFVRVPRWTEAEALNNLLAANDAPDICVTYDYPTVLTYANMGGVLDLNQYLDKNKDMIPNLWNLLGEDNLYWDQDPDKKTIWAIESKLFQNKRVNTFVREDWLKKLNISEPTTIDEFEAMLKAFKDNASKLLGKDADKMVPLSISFDVGWRADTMLNSFIPDNISDKDMYVYGFDDRRLLLPGYKNGVKKLNDWYNAGLLWKDFALYPAGDKTEDNMIKAGYVGAFMHNWDYPYRDGDNGITANLKKLVGSDAAFIAVDAFKNDKGAYRKYLSAPIDRKIFFPATNDEPIASMLYLDWISKLENRKFLQIGEEGVTNEKQPDGSVKIIAAKGDKIVNSPNNIDYTITINGLDLGDKDLTIKSIANNYAGVDPKLASKAYAIAGKDTRVGKRVSVGPIKAEEGQGTVLKEKRDKLLDQAITAKTGQFDSVFDSGMQDYLKSGGQAIIDERKAAYEKYYK